MTFQRLLGEGYVYVDKTAYAPDRRKIVYVDVNFHDPSKTDGYFILESR